MKCKIIITTGFDANIGNVEQDDIERLKKKLSAAVEEIIYDFMSEQVQQNYPIKVEIDDDELKY